MKIFDVFTFYNELDLLELRMEILGDVVDYFVINEATITFTGKEKPLYYFENRERFKKWEDKIIHHVTVDDNDDLKEYWSGVPYHRNMVDYGIHKLPLHYQRACFHKDNAIYGLLDIAKDDDIIISSDADEIANPEAIKALSEWFDPKNHYVLRGPVFYYYLNLFCEDNWMGPRVATMGKLKTMSIDFLRESHAESWKIDNAAWHWSFFGDADMVRSKMDAYEHQENNLKQFRDTMEDRIAQGVDPYGRDYLYKPTTVPIDESFPDYIVNNQEKLARFIRG